jgi:hypothetical protein
MLAGSWYRKMLSLCLGRCAPFRVTRNPDVGRQLVPKNALTCLGLCAPLRVTRNPDIGRQLVATRRIAAGEILCQEEPLIVGPNQVKESIPRNRFRQPK